MQATIFEVLQYLFEAHFQEGRGTSIKESVLVDELVDAGFNEAVIGKAFGWLAKLSTLNANKSTLSDNASVRVFSQYERDHLDADCRGFLLQLEQRGILDAVAREIVIDRVIGLNAGRIDVSQIKWVALLVLFSEPARKDALSSLENLVLNEW